MYSNYIEQPWIFIVFFFWLGACIGSFLNVVIYRLPVILERRWLVEATAIRCEERIEFPKFTLATPRSRCPHCNYAIKPYENIPIFSYLLLRGRCKSCAQRISPRYPFVEILTATLTTLIFFRYGLTSFSLAATIFTWSIICLTFIDLDTQLLPDDITLPLIWAGLLFNTFTETIPLEQSVLGASVGYLTLWSIYWAFKLTTGKEGMGYGDFKLLAAIGAFFGLKSIPAVILISSIMGSVVGIYLLIARKHSKNQPIPFGPYLSAACLITLYFPAVSNCIYA